jgi:hypothetical protein
VAALAARFTRQRGVRVRFEASCSINKLSLRKTRIDIPRDDVSAFA